ncbi:2842_t:CDS:2 [Paraglomus brasilianum]|uniref:2842_t:CDS:1 n=1 Tax=Paraglomus brasilianum TaxID=144538 RepID=A0A9N9AM13_9GLOM|nr:2842_t:CDS:2 [Paraglomus brasilianum]
MNTNTDEHLAKLKQQCEQGLVTQEVYDRKQLQILDEEDSKGPTTSQEIQNLNAQLAAQQEESSGGRQTESHNITGNSIETLQQLGIQGFSQISTTKQNKGHFQNFWSSCLTPNSNESIYVFSYLLAAVNTFRDDFKFWPEKLIEGINGRGPVNFAIEAYNGQIVGMMEVKKGGLQESGCTECWNLIDIYFL